MEGSPQEDFKLEKTKKQNKNRKGDSHILYDDPTKNKTNKNGFKGNVGV
jgi:hypothetical protein